MKETESIVKTDTVRVRIMSLDPREIADWHYHTQVTDDIFCASGNILIRVQDPNKDFLNREAREENLFKLRDLPGTARHTVPEA